MRLSTTKYLIVRIMYIMLNKVLHPDTVVCFCGFRTLLRLDVRNETEN